MSIECINPNDKNNGAPLTIPLAKGLNPIKLVDYAGFGIDNKITPLLLYELLPLNPLRL